MCAIPPHVAERLRPVCDATGLKAQDIWDRQSLATQLEADPALARRFKSQLNRDEKAVLRFCWSFWGRPSQQIPAGAWFIWLVLAGRGWGKTRTGAQFVIHEARTRPGSRGALVGPTQGAVRDVMILGESGLMACSPPDFRPEYEPSKGLITWPNKSQAAVYSAEKPDRLRGPQFDWSWCDELAAWRYPEHPWDMLLYGMRLPGVVSPRCCVTTTPRPIPLLTGLVEQSRDPLQDTILTRGTTYDNYWHLHERFFTQVISRNQGSLARQEIFAELLELIQGALWSLKLIDKYRWTGKAPSKEHYARIVVSVDPAEEAGKDNDEVGIVAVARDHKDHGYVVEDESCQGSPATWGRAAYELYLRLDADAIVVETNRGGQMVAHVIRSVVRPDEPRPRIIEVKASRGKATRAEPIAAIYEEGRFHHVGNLAVLENELTHYVPGVTKQSPNRMDALVWGATELFKPHRIYGSAA